MSNAQMESKLKIWKEQLGLLPVPLFAPTSADDQFVLLNGTVGNFCLDFNSQEGIDPVGYAWSSDVGHYIKAVNHHIEVYRWDKGENSIERYKTDSVERNLERFYRYLQKDQPNQENSIIYFFLKIFRVLRRILLDIDPLLANGDLSLKAFLFLIACAEDKQERQQLNLNRWELDEESLRIASSIRNGDWYELLENLESGISFYNLKPNISLLLRHASGQLFQDAHYDAYSVDLQQLTIEGVLPSPLLVNKKLSSLSTHYTPPSLARTLVEEALLTLNICSTDKIFIFDPACGSGVFLKEVLKQLWLKGYQGQIKITGWDLSPAATDMAKFSLASEKRNWGQNQVEIEICVRDALDQGNLWPNNIDLILMNPPFISWLDMKEDQRKNVLELLGELASNRPDLSSPFILKAIRNLKEGGVIGTILPASILDGESYKRFREEINSSVDFKLIGKLGNQNIFKNATIDAALLVATKEENKESASTLLWADHRLDSLPNSLRALRRYRRVAGPNVIDEDSYSIYQAFLGTNNSQNWKPTSYKSYKLYQLLNDLTRVKDIFRVQQGVRTGLNSVFIMSKKDYLDLPSGEQIFFRPAVVNESINSGVLSDLAYVFYPYGDNLPEIKNEDDLQKEIKTFYEKKLKPNKEKLIQRVRTDESNWWKLSEYRAWQVEKKPKLVSTYFGKAGYFAWDSRGDYVVVQGHAWSVKANKVKRFSEDINLAYLAILYCPFINNLLSSISNHVGGGQWNLSAKFIHEMPLPDLTDKDTDTELLSSLVEFGSRISKGRENSEQELYSLVLSLYRIPEELASIGYEQF